jgi:protein-S-isoprenylcysteine O-methyltransferase Ste14
VTAADRGRPSHPRRGGSTGRAAPAILALAWVACVFVAAGTVRWLTGWLYVVVVAGGVAAHQAFLAGRNPELVERRTRIGEGTRAWDLAWVAIFWPLMVSAPVVAGVDTVRLGHPELPAFLPAIGGLVFAAGMALSAWAMAVNRFFEGTARIQAGQQVVDAGPYRRVRHPGYAGLLLWALSSPLLLRSGWALVPAVLTAAWLVVRTALEDRMLREELAGYGDYARRVPARLVPGIW